MDFYTWTHQCWDDQRKLASALNEHWMPSKGLSKSDGRWRLRKRERERERKSGKSVPSAYLDNDDEDDCWLVGWLVG